MKYLGIKGTAAVVILMATLCQGDIYEELVDANSVLQLPQYNYCGAHLIDGDTAYVIARGIESVITPIWETAIRRIDNISSGSPTVTTLVSNAQWMAYTGDDYGNIGPGNHMAVFGDQLQFVDYFDDAIYRVNVTTGALSTLVSPSDIMAHTGESEAKLLDAVAVYAPNQEMTVYDEKSDRVLLVAPDGTLTTLITPADFQSLYGGTHINYVGGGMAFDTSGNLYWTSSKSGSSGTGSIYKRKTDGTMSEIVTQAEIDDLIGIIWINPGEYNDIYYGPDDNIYFYERESDNILRFDPARAEAGDPNSLQIFLTKAEMVDGPQGIHRLSAFSSYEGKALTWNNGLSGGLRSAGGIFYRVVLPDNCDEVQRFGYDLAAPEWTQDCYVSLFDFSILADAWLIDEGGDLDNDGLTNMADLILFASEWLWCNDPQNASCEKNWLIP